MFKVNDYVMYGITGVCEILDIKKEELRNKEKKDYYVLKPVYSSNTIIKIPVDNMKISMRKIHSKAEVDYIINSIPNEKSVLIDDEKERNEKFKSMLKSGECNEWIQLIKSIYENKRYRKSVGKKLGKGDDEIMKTAERLINEEFATILNISPEEVNAYIENNIPK